MYNDARNICSPWHGLVFVVFAQILQFRLCSVRFLRFSVYRAFHEKNLENDLVSGCYYFYLESFKLKQWMGEIFT